MAYSPTFWPALPGPIIFEGEFMAQTPWSLSSGGIDPRELAAIGQQALKSGQISPEEAAEHAKEMGLKMPSSQVQSAAAQGQVQPAASQANSYTPSVSMANSSSTSGYMDMNQAQGVGEAGSAIGKMLQGIKGAKASIENDTTNKSSTGMTQKTWLTPEQMRANVAMAQGIDPVTGKVDPNNPIVQQKQGLADMQDMLRMSQQSGANWIQPLAKLADARAAETGKQTNLAQGLSSPEEQQNQFMKFADEIQKRRGDIQTSLNENIKNLNGGQITSQLQQALLNKQVAGIDNSKPDRQSLQDQRLAFQTHKNMMARLDTDPILKSQLQGDFGLDNALATIVQAKNITPNQLVEAQRTIMAAMSAARGGQTGIDERAQMYLNTMGQGADRLAQWLSGTPSNISPNDPMVQHIINLAKIEQGNIQEVFGAHLGALKAGSEWMYDDPTNQKYSDSLTTKLQAMRSQFLRHPATANATSSSGSAPGASGNYDGSTPLPPNASPDQKTQRLNFLKSKAGV